MASAAGRRIVEMVWEDSDAARHPDDAGVRERRDRGDGARRIDERHHPPDRDGRAAPAPASISISFDALSRRTPFLANIRPSGQFLMEDFYYAGGLRGVLDRLRDLLHTDCLTVNGKTLGENIDGAFVSNDDVIALREQPIGPEGGVAVLRGNLAPDGAVIKHTAARAPAAAAHRARPWSSATTTTSRSGSTIRHCRSPPIQCSCCRTPGPLGAPGMPEWGMLPIPKKLLAQGVRDMVRISDARMSGTSYGACVLHVAPESFAGGPLAFVRDGDLIELDVPARRLTLRVADDELARRRAGWKPREVAYPRGFGHMYARHVTQANRGMRLRFPRGNGRIAEPEIH